MPTNFMLRRLVCARLALVLVLVLVSGVVWAAPPTNVVISQVYGAGGNSGAVLNADYVELFNPTGSTLTLNNYSIQYASAAGTTIATVTTLPATITLAPGQYYLVAASAGTNGAALPATPDFTGTNIAFGAAAGKIALVSSTTKLSSVCSGTSPTTDPTLVDFVAYGTGTNCSFGSAAPAPSTTTADIRTNACDVIGNSGTEFKALTPNPHNSSSTPFVCGAPRRWQPPERQRRRRSM